MALYEDARPGLGHNLPPTALTLEHLLEREAELTQTGNVWLQSTAEIADQEQADALTGFLKQVALLRSDADATRKTEKQPFLDGAAAVDEKYRPVIQRADTTKRLLEPRLTAYHQRKRQEQEAEARRQREEAERARRAAEEERRKAEELVRAAEAGRLSEADNVIGQIQRAEEVAREAEAAEKAAKEAASAKVHTGAQYAVGGRKRAASLRTHTVITVSDVKKAAAYLARIGAPELIEACEKAGRRIHRADPNAALPGFTITTEERIAI